LSRNSSITWEIVCANPEKPWNYCQLSKNPNITWKIVQSNPEFPWDFESLSSNPNITWDIVQSNPEFPWDFASLSSNPNITWKIIQDNPDKDWHDTELCLNAMTPAREDFIRKKLQQWFQKSELKEELMASVWNPRNFHKFKWMDPEVFGELDDE
jgi:hypothetical protein